MCVRSTGVKKANGRDTGPADWRTVHLFSNNSDAYTPKGFVGKATEAIKKIEKDHLPPEFVGGLMQ